MPKHVSGTRRNRSAQRYSQLAVYAVVLAFADCQTCAARRSVAAPSIAPSISALLQPLSKSLPVLAIQLSPSQTMARQFVSDEFTNFVQSRDIQQQRTAVYNHQQNGRVESFNRYLKHDAQTFNSAKKELAAEMQALLYSYSTTSATPGGSSCKKRAGIRS